jgi:hypothetical protein
MQEIATWMESFLGRYVNTERVASDQWRPIDGWKPGLKLRVPPGQIVQIRLGKAEVQLEVSIEKPVEDAERWARSIGGRTCYIRHESGETTTNDNINGGDRLVVHKGPRAMQDVIKVTLVEGENKRVLAFMGQYSKTEAIRRLEYEVGYLVDQTRVKVDDQPGWDGRIQSGMTITLPEPIVALLILEAKERVARPGRDFPAMDVHHYIFHWWRILAHQVQAWWRQSRCEDIREWPDRLVIRIERVDKPLGYYVAAVCDNGVRIEGVNGEVIGELLGLRINGLEFRGSEGGSRDRNSLDRTRSIVSMPADNF